MQQSGEFANRNFPARKRIWDLEDRPTDLRLLHLLTRGDNISVTWSFFSYAVSIINLGMLAGGGGIIIGLITDLFPLQSSIQVGKTACTVQKLSLGLALTIIGGVLWFLFWSNTQQMVKGKVEETGSAIRAWYFNIINFVSFVIVIVATTDFISWIIRYPPAISFSTTSLSNFIIFSAIMFYHYRLQKTEGQPLPAAKTMRR